MRTYAQQKAGLTRAVKSKRYDKVLAECKRVIVEWQALPYGWPDDWHRWNIALDDAYSHARHEYVKGRLSVLPPYVTFEDLRWAQSPALSIVLSSEIDGNLAIQLLGYAAAVSAQAPASLIARYNARLTAIGEEYLTADEDGGQS